MKKFRVGISVLVLVMLVFSSCIKHEVIPPPVPKVDLYSHFIGTINGTGLELTENVNGFYCKTSQAKKLVPSPALSSAVYYSEMVSASKLTMIRVGIGSVFWDQTTSTVPTLALFNSFFTSNLTPVYSLSSASGFEVTYRDNTGKVWVSDPLSTNPQTVTFSSIKQESDGDGDYSKFKCNFDCYVYRLDKTDTLNPVLLNLHIQNATFEGWFKR